MLKSEGGWIIGGGSFDEPSTSPREDASDTREPSRALDAGPRTVDLGPRTVDRTQTAPKPKASEPTNDGKTILTYPCRVKGGNPTNNSGEEWTLTQGQVDKWDHYYASTNVLGECRKALAWVEANATRRKTTSGMPKFLVGWLNRASHQDVGGKPGGGRGW